MSRQMRREDSGENSQVVQAPIVEVLNPSTYDNYAAGGSRSPFSDLWSRVLRIKITGRDGLEKLDLRIPVSHLCSSSYTNYLIPFILSKLARSGITGVLILTQFFLTGHKLAVESTK